MVQSYNYTLYDLGVSYRLMYLFAYHHTIIYYGQDIIYDPLPFSKFIFIPLSISLFFYNNIFTPLLLQIIVIASGGYAVFRISQIKTKNMFISVLIELSYFLYPSTYGFMTHGGNFQVFLEGFILIGYMFYLEGKKVQSFLAFALASITNMWAPAIVLAFLFIDFLTRHDIFNIKTNKYIKKNLHTIIINLLCRKKDFIFYIFILFFNIIIFIQTVHFAGGLYTLISSSRVSSASLGVTSSGPISSIYQNILSNYGSIKLPFFFKELFPVIFIPLLTPYFILILLYFLVSWTSSASSYYSVLQQYPYLFASFIFIGTAHFFGNITKDKNNIQIAKKIAVLLLIASIVSFALYSPFSVNNFENGTVEKEIHVTKFDKDLSYGLSLIPSHASVFIQNDLPQLMNREQVYMPGYYNNQTVGFAVIIPYGFSPTSDVFGGYSQYWAEHFQDNSSYGIYEQISGAIIYKLNYSGKPVYSVPYTNTILPGENSLNGNGKIINHVFIMSNFTNIYHNSMWGGGYITLSPGKYNFTFQIETMNTSNKNIFYQDVWGGSGQYKFTSLQINGNDFKQSDEWQNFTITLTLNQYYTNLEFPAFFMNWNGTIEFKGIVITQVI